MGTFIKDMALRTLKNLWEELGTIARLRCGRKTSSGKQTA